MTLTLAALGRQRPAIVTEGVFGFQYNPKSRSRGSSADIIATDCFMAFGPPVQP